MLKQQSITQALVFNIFPTFLPSMPYHISRKGGLTRQHYIARALYLRTAVDDDVARLEKKDIRIDGKLLPNLGFACDIVIFSENTSKKETILKELREAGKRMGYA
ncbi:hypothetical protein KIN20_016217 [Parelaphostrongylus tenuis]|uniref:Uncharacterized protein n=1 Tax=Parelaphostrongylus tenuis TaxID=148309 RepID=A0AAD5QT19_PARTN|nr:hypothetical protein KIN20_016217 [Parelaphostrongylus tenuis]